MIVSRIMEKKFTIGLLSKEIQGEAGRPINCSSIFARIRKKTVAGQIIRVGKGVYATSNRPVFEYELHSSLARQVRSELKDIYGNRLEFAVYETTILNHFLNHLIANTTILVDVPREYCEHVFFALVNRGFKNLLLNPSEDENYRYNHFDGKTIVIKCCSSRSPIDKKKNTILLEKVLVDIVADKRLRYFFEGAETGPMIQEITENYSLDYAKVRTYAKRRGCYESLCQYIPAEIRQAYL